MHPNRASGNLLVFPYYHVQNRKVPINLELKAKVGTYGPTGGSGKKSFLCIYRRIVQGHA